jgi:uncharacterized membrane protein
MEIRKMNAARGWTWVRHGFQLIMLNPLMSVTLALVSALAMFALLKVPLIGPLVSILLMPAVLAGYMRVCRALEEEEDVELEHLFAGFRKYFAKLVAVGSYLMLGLLASSMVMIFIGGEPLRTLLDGVNASSDPQALLESMWAAGSGVALSLVIGFSLMCIVMLAFQYAPMLVFFNDVPPVAAMRASLTGSLRNLLPYTVYNIIMQVIAVILSVVPFNMGLVLLLPLGLTSLYVSYRNIFPFAHELAAAHPVSQHPEA